MKYIMIDTVGVSNKQKNGSSRGKNEDLKNSIQ